MEIKLVENYFNAWNNHDPDTLVALFAEKGTYWDPTTDKELSGNAIKQYAVNMISAFPDISFDLQNIALTENSVVAIQWVMKGTNTGPMLKGLPPTNNSITLPGTNFIEGENNLIRSVKGYFDQKTLFEQLGFDNIVQPRQLGNITFGTALRVSSDKNKKPPSAMAMTWIVARSKNELEEIVSHATKINQEWSQSPGFIGLIEGFNQNRGFTATAWESIEDVKRAAHHGPAHTDAMKHFKVGLSGGVFTSLWVPYKLNTLWIRCENCGTANDGTRTDGLCTNCGMPLPEQPSFW
ncbi:ester cyclase [Mastigocoleus testarum]|uniref:SnoaL-like domain-containing protein n=1 Tax=Mastigocoleus testarum BC008 TaxID=371196 RepID=A0A0V7ZMH6_9CYAN|nr:ester cyclase [Mastigocoleus testarum]KST65713.1 hypothetical protein BC008_22310 [Mastigocoleus testarum BC008]